MPQCYWNYQNIVLGLHPPDTSKSTKNYDTYHSPIHTPGLYSSTSTVRASRGAQLKLAGDEQGSAAGIFRCLTLTNPHFCLPNTSTSTPVRHPPPLEIAPSDDTVTQKVPACDNQRTLHRIPGPISPNSQSFTLKLPASSSQIQHLPQITSPTGTANLPRPHPQTFLQQEPDLNPRIALHPTQTCIKVRRCQGWGYYIDSSQL